MWQKGNLFYLNGYEVSFNYLFFFFFNLQQYQTPHRFQTEKSQIAAVCLESELYACCIWFPLSPTPQDIPSLAKMFPFRKMQGGSKHYSIPWLVQPHSLFTLWHIFVQHATTKWEHLFQVVFLNGIGERFVSNLTWIANKSLLNTLLWLYFPLAFSFLYLFQSVFYLIKSTEKLVNKECSCLLTLFNTFYFSSFKCFGSDPCPWHYSSTPDLCLEQCLLASFLLLTGWLLCAGLLLSMGQGLGHPEISTGFSTWLQCFFFSLLTKTNQGLVVLNTVLLCLFSSHVYSSFPFLASKRRKLEEYHFCQFTTNFELWKLPEGVREHI